MSARAFAELSDDGSENAHRAMAHHLREVTAAYALSAANMAGRSDWTLGREGLSRKKGYNSPEDYVQALGGGGGGGTKADTRRLIEAGTMATEAEAARARQKEADLRAAEYPEAPPVEVHRPWLAPLGDAVTDGTLSTDAATAIRRALGVSRQARQRALGVTEEMLSDAIEHLMAECRTLNADQAAKAARQRRDTIDAAGIASRADGRAHCGRAHCGRAHDGRAHDGRAHDGRAYFGRAHEGRAHDGRAHCGRAHNGRAHDDAADNGLGASSQRLHRRNTRRRHRRHHRPDRVQHRVYAGVVRAERHRT
ncbi:hypothetical protein JF66_00330 [Cryobacterium sp. MLB-32]|uniref:hypothetical protein n=1 Tax=Cryobacterium sp. MLB-32 TaxID=1529318 RepID=UPI0004E67D3B|nr:hypothetical protein [Cryobacterium sp. MLB-32]KFF61073.1 hypothetical protein JF66_00330 [Cryobacterium sp. MLB-32]